MYNIYQDDKNEEEYQVKKIIRTGILLLTLVLTLLFSAAFAECTAAGGYIPLADKGLVLTQGTSIQAKHDSRDAPEEFLNINKRDLTLQKGKSETLKVSLKPSGKSVSVTWKSSNPKIAKVSGSGKVTAVAPGTVIISVTSKKYKGFSDQTGMSDECYVTVPGGSKDAKPLGTGDRTYYYGKKQFTVPTSKYKEALAKVKKSIGGYDFSDGNGNTGLQFDSQEVSKVHTYIYIYSNIDENGKESFYGYGFIACGGFIADGDSPIITSRGLKFGAKKSAVQQKYGLPAWVDNPVTIGGRDYEIFTYQTKVIGKNLYSHLRFWILKSNSTVMQLQYYLGDIKRP